MIIEGVAMQLKAFECESLDAWLFDAAPAAIRNTIKVLEHLR